MELKQTVQHIVDEITPRTIAIRQQIHQHPELSFKETETSKLVCSELERMGIPYQLSPVAPGVIAELDSGKPGKLLLLRADMDALPIQEEVEVPFASQVEKVMHACGHDVHTANLLAVADVLNRTKEHWCGRVKLVFQPGEESGGGGREMIAKGLLEELPDACFALHVDETMEGQIRIEQGYLTAYSDGYHLRVTGRAAHSSTPNEGVDAIYIAAHIITALHGISSRSIDPMDDATLNIGLIQGGSAGNILAEEVNMGVMLRNLSKDSRDAMCKSIESIASNVAAAFGGRCDAIFRPGYPAMYNDLVFTQFVETALTNNADLVAGDLLEPDKLITRLNHGWLGAEDFGFYSQKVPACLVLVGTGGAQAKHSGTFCIEEKYIPLCTRAMASVALEFLAP